jgi:hypothetical protein
MPRIGLVASLGIAMLCACAPPEPDATPEGPVGVGQSETSPLLASVKASTFGADSVVFSLQVTNTAAGPLELSFSSGQSFDFVVMRGAEEVWRWSSDRMFTQALRSDTLAPGETRSYSATWAPVPRASGEYTVHGRLTARNVRAEQSTQFRL